jgi:hypothetical protein
MKTNLVTKISAAVIVIAIAVAFAPNASSSEVVVKRGGQAYAGPAKSQFATPKTIATLNACVSSCKTEFVPVLTQDSKLKTKTIVVAKHGCGSCSDSIKTIGAQKATGKNVAVHTCGGRLITMNTTCCSTTP